MSDGEPMSDDVLDTAPDESAAETATPDEGAGETASPEPAEPRSPKSQRAHRARGYQLTAPLLVGIAIRLLLAPFTSEEHDAAVWVDASLAGSHHLSLYARPTFSYPSGWGHVLQFLGLVLPHLGLPPSSFGRQTAALALLQSRNTMAPLVSSPIYDLAVKLFLFAFDVGTAYLVYALIFHVTSDEAKARRGFIVFFLNPLVIFASAVLMGFNMLVAFAILLAIFSVVTDRPAIAGAAIAVGALVKVVPVFIVPLIAVAIFCRALPRLPESAAADRRGRYLSAGRLALPDLIRFLAGAVVAGVVVAAPEIVSHSLSAMYKQTFARESGFSNVAGLNLYGLETFRGLGGLAGWSNIHLTTVRQLSEVLVALAVAWSAFRVWRDRGATYGMLVASCGVYGAFLLSQPLTQPLYVIWIMPLVVVLRSGYGKYRWELWVCTFAPVAFVVASHGPWYFIAPLAAYTSHVSLDSIARSVFSWTTERTSGLWSYTVQNEVVALAVAAGVVMEIALLVKAVLSSAPTVAVSPPATDALGIPDLVGTASGQAAPDDEGEEGTGVDTGADTGPRPSAPPRARSRPPRVAVNLAYCLLGSLLVVSLVDTVAVGAGRPGGSLELLQAAVNGDRLSSEIAVSSAPGQRSLRLVAFPIREATPIRLVYVYDDAHYPSFDSEVNVKAMFIQHLLTELRLRDAKVVVKPLGAAGLYSVLGDTTAARGTAIVDLTGVLPASSFSKAGNRVTPWLRSGGVLVWGGGPIGFYSGESSPRGGARSRLSLGWSGPRVLLGMGASARLVEPVFVNNSSVATPSAMASDLGINFSLTEVRVSLRAANRLGAQVLGWTGAGVSSVTTVSVGAGSVVIFAGVVRPDVYLTTDVSLILLSHAYAAAGPPVATTVPIARIGQQHGRVSWTTLLGAKPVPGGSVELFAFDPDPAGTLGAAWVVPVPAG